VADIRKARRRPRGSAWHWKQTDGWYYTPPGTKQRVALRDESGRSIRGAENKSTAELALARLKVDGHWKPAAEQSLVGQWLVGRVCSEFIQHCQRGVENGSLSAGYRDWVHRYLNVLCEYCGALPVADLAKGHIEHWIESHPQWRSPATRRNIMTTVLAAFNHAQTHHGVPHRLKGLKKPPAQPRLFSFDADEEQSLYEAVPLAFRDFLFAAIHTGLRPFCELARLTADDVIETPRGMLWRVYSSKTKKSRTIPVRSEVARLVRRLMRSAPSASGIPLFRNPQGNPWLKVTAVGRFLMAKRVLGWDKNPVRSRYSCYTCRHTFAHRMLGGYWNSGKGCSIEVLAELIGDTPKVAFDHYGREWGQLYQEPLWAALGLAAPSRVRDQD